MFEIYKKGQGYWTRLLTMLGGGLIVLIGAYWLYEGPLVQLAKLFPFNDSIVRIPLTTAFVVGLGYLTFYISYLKPGTGDFFIATEGEMKKVSWSSKREIIGSTAVVVVTLGAMAVLLFAVDILFMAFFTWMGVLKIPIKNIFFGGGG